MRMLPVFLLLSACAGSNLATHENGVDDGLDSELDDVPPTIEHDPITATQVFGEDVPITATVSDDDGGAGILFVYLYYKNETAGDGDWTKLAMTSTDGLTYTSTIRGDDETSGGIYYFLEALDKANNSAEAPAAGRDDPYHFRLSE